MEVKILDLSHNQISWIEKRAFRNVSSLEILDLSNNRITADVLIPEIFEGHYDPETYIPLKTLKVLRLGNNELHSLNPDLFEHLPNLEELSLDSNPFKVIDHNSEIAISGINTLKARNYFFYIIS
jgi:Leucine-rich repeat (LRR) protein